jgi:hypothetical protein
MSSQPGRYQRSFRGMIGAMFVLLLVVAAFVAFRSAVRNDPADPVKAVDYKHPAQFARDEADFDVLVPRELPDGWIATSVRYVGGQEQSWHLGLLTPERRYVGLEQADRPASSMVEEFVDENAVPGDEVRIDGKQWQRWTDSGDDVALVRTGTDGTTLVVGTVPESTLAKFVTSLG